MWLNCKSLFIALNIKLHTEKTFCTIDIATWTIFQSYEIIKVLVSIVLELFINLRIFGTIPTDDTFDKSMGMISNNYWII